MRTLRCSHCNNGQIKKLMIIHRTLKVCELNEQEPPTMIPSEESYCEICMYCLGSSMIFEDK